MVLKQVELFFNCQKEIIL
jgi:hypothetical protein